MVTIVVIRDSFLPFWPPSRWNGRVLLESGGGTSGA